MNRERVPLTPIAPLCATFGCNAKAEVWLRATDGVLVPGGTFCGLHAAATMSQYLVHLGEEWSSESLVMPCAHRRDPRDCPECWPHKFGRTEGATDEPHAPANAGDFGCVRCGAWTTYCLSAEQANEKLGPCSAVTP